jgi:molybdate transport repressor ModE-like protein
MIRVGIEPHWRFWRDGDQQSVLVLLGFLNEIRTTGKITQAAREADMSYRHAWNLIEKWSAFFEMPLVSRRQGSGTSLTPFGDKLVWAGQRLDARLGPQLQNLAQELETELNQILHHGPTVVRMHASHGFAVSKLREILGREADIGVDVRYVSNQNSLVSLAHGACEMAGLHLPLGPLRKRSVAAARAWLTPANHRVITFVTREMGLMIKKGNPLGITSLRRLFNPDIRFVNRDPESGTRLIFEQMLVQEGLDERLIAGHEQVEFTHAACAAYVASGMADVGFGVEAAARQFDLDFIRLITEDYIFVCHKQILDLPSVQRVLAIMQGDEFRDAISRLPGYTASGAGHIRTVRDIFRSTE